ncbi:MAG: hypothetical protein KC486_28105, partial [Myxococcales bacterium]|nr:hypothetical protein [Myxococcales bacterium]
MSAIDLRRDGVRDVLRVERDACDREIVRLLPGGAIARTRRDPRGRPLAQEVSPGHDPFDRILGAPPSSTISRRHAWSTDARPSDATPRELPTTAAPSDPPETTERDAAGRVIRCSTSAGALHLRWDAAGRLRAIETAAGELFTFTYDALGRRVRRTTPAATTTWVWAGDRPVIEEERRDDGAASLRQWVFAPPGHGGAADHFAPLAATIDGDLVSLVSDLVGAPLATSDRSGALIDAPLPFAEAGHHIDRATGLQYARHRYLDPASGRFLSPDPSGLRGGLDPTAYVADPATEIDPLGLRGLPALAPWPDTADGSATDGPLHPEPDPPAPTAPDIMPPNPNLALSQVASSPAGRALDTAYSRLRPLSR